MTYTCPMHPEVVSEVPGKCPKCGMNLVPKDTASAVSHHTTEKDDYTPLVVILGMILAVALATAWQNSSGVTGGITAFMTGFFLVFSAFKLMDLRGFAEGYATYDLLAQRVYGYGFLYPFIELAFGFSMLLGYHPVWLLWLEIVVMLFSGLGVVIKLAKKERFRCACLGTFLKVPLTLVSILENFGMAFLALVLLSI